MNKLVMFLLLSAPTQALSIDESIQIVPAKWFTSGGETAPLNYSGQPELPRAALLGMFENEAVSDDGHAVATEFAKDDDQAIFILFDSGRILKYDYIDKKIDWDRTTSDDARQFALSEDGKRIAVTERNGVVILRSNDGSTENILANACLGPCMAVTLSNDLKFAVVGDASGTAHIIEINTPSNRWSRKNHDWPLRKILYLENNSRRFVVTSDSIEVVLYDLTEDEERRRMTSRHERDGFRDFWINSLKEVPGSNHFVVGGYNDVFILDAVPGDIIATYTESEQVIVSAYASRDLSRVSAVSKDHVIYSWNTDNGSVLSKHWMETPLLAMFTHTAISPDGTKTAVTSTELIFAFPPRAPNRVRIYRTPQ